LGFGFHDHPRERNPIAMFVGVDAECVSVDFLIWGLKIYTMTGGIYEGYVFWRSLRQIQDFDV
jgi:hypothetical protein